MDATTQPLEPQAPDNNGVVGALAGTIARRHGRLVERRSVRVTRVIERAADLAVADRLGYLWTGRMRRQTAVVESDGWYYLVELDEVLTRSRVPELAHPRPREGTVRMMSIIDGSGVLPVLEIS